MACLSSVEDREFKSQFEACAVPPAHFDHRAHLRLAYVYLCEHDTESAGDLMRDALNNFLEHLGADPSKYHETMTRAWILAVRHFMTATASSKSAESFIAQNPNMLDPSIMMTHYSAQLLFSNEARAIFLDPDLDPIPRYKQEQGYWYLQHNS